MPQLQQAVDTPARVDRDRETGHLNCAGDWTLAGLEQREKALQAIAAPRQKQQMSRGQILDVTAIQGFDTAGALVLQQVLQRLGEEVSVVGLNQRQSALLKLVAQHGHSGQGHGTVREDKLTTLGRRTVEAGLAVLAFLSFIGGVTLEALPRLLRPAGLRWKQVAAELQKAGTHALPILGMLSFLTGVVIAYQGGTPLVRYGANILIVDLLTITMLREMAPLITAIIVAGRTGSAYAAQIGTMRITEEVDALRTLGMTPVDILVLPKLLALVIAMPLLTVYADGLGLLGGMLVAQTMFDVSITEFIQRMPEAIAASSFWVGIIKAPVFAVLIVAISCHHGFAVQGSTESVGRATTRSVVQGIFLVIVADAAFSIVFNLVGL